MKSTTKKTKANARKKKACEWGVMLRRGTTDAIEDMTVKLSSYTRSAPKRNCRIKVAGVPKKWNGVDQVIKTTVFENAEYKDGFVSVDGGKNWYLPHNFFFHKVKRGQRH